MIPAELGRLLERKTGGVFYLHGADEYRKDLFANALLEAYLDPGTRDFNFDLFRGGETDVERLASALDTPPMMAEWRVVMVREVQGLAGSARARDLLVSVASSPPEGVLVVLLCTPPRDSKAKFYGELEKAARSVAFDPPSPEELPHLLVEWAREGFGRELEEGAARALAQAVGADLAILRRELEKLSTLVGDGGRITREVVEAAGIRLPRQDRWEWFDTVGRRRFREALRSLPVLLDQGESGVGLVSALGTHLLRIAVALDGGPEALAPLFPPPMRRWAPKRYAEQARGWTAEELDRALAGLLRTDELLKSSRVSGEHLLEAWLLERVNLAEAA